MNLHYLTQLDEREIIALINYCLMGKLGSVAAKEYLVGWALIHNDFGIRDIDNNRYYSVDTARELKLLPSYVISDFHLRLDHSKMICPECYKLVDDNFDKEMRMYMAMRFGRSYVDDLYTLQVRSATAEKRELEEFIGLARK